MEAYWGKLLLAVVLGLMGIYLILSALFKPIKLLWRLGVLFVGGVILLFVSNLVLYFWGISLPYNLVTILVAGILNIPGIILLIILKSVVG